MAALYVAVYHTSGQLFSDAVKYAEIVNPKSNWHWWEWFNVAVFQHAKLGLEFVILFFLLSGFSIANSLKNNTDIAGFYKRRAIRLYPTYLIGILWALLAFLLIKIFAENIYFKPDSGYQSVQHFFHNFIRPESFLSNLFYVPIDNVFTSQYWSLPLEVIFYLLAPWVISRMRMLGIVTLVLYVIGLVVFGTGYSSLTSENILLQYTTEYGIYFVVGMLFYQYKDKLISTFPLGKAATVVALVIVFELMIYLKAYTFKGVPNKLTGWFSILFTYLILFGSLKYNVRVWLLEKVGHFSYTLYISHQATIWIVKIVSYRLGMNYHYIHNMFFWYFGLATCLIVAFGLYLLVERPVNIYLQKLRKQNNKDQHPEVPSTIATTYAN